jgi:hypothetical protein
MMPLLVAMPKTAMNPMSEAIDSVPPAASRLLFGRDWFAPPRIGRYAAVVGVAIAIQISVEWAALATGRREYAPWHPKILGSGFLPILQAVVLTPVAFILLATMAFAAPGPAGLIRLRVSLTFP